ncbi:MAG: hypothetical protein A3A16_03710 [Candidatus Harrisonbacteria bacterium RIFCSPLOWO2_01_FULL_44_18]|uniref:Uncharacterized protein n=1 Tax=Candidatus Harrisonbacteria bacterium RIFCSPLOWO2_01_FULL_44_18 TaxID=1798407 RepID=A0A1G1ZME2_9BACT|nr:MAG: hypothetical protein A3A16_03710 [Candidatus Harrisonbacteria bacterium RIFCSPLOWO2_01_FULL_44_18]
MPQKQQQKKNENAKGSAAGRNSRKSARYQEYSAAKGRAERVLRRMLRSNGPKEACVWAERTSNVDVLNGLAQVFGGEKAGQLARQAIERRQA